MQRIPYGDNPPVPSLHANAPPFFTHKLFVATFALTTAALLEISFSFRLTLTAQGYLCLDLGR